MVDVAAFPLEEALEECKKMGLEVEVRKTYPVKPIRLTNKWRVVRQTEENGKIILLAAQECAGEAP